MPRPATLFIQLCLIIAACDGGLEEIESLPDAPITPATDDGSDDAAPVPPTQAERIPVSPEPADNTFYEPFPGPVETATSDGVVTHLARDGSTRRVNYRLWYPVGLRGLLPVVIVSHGGSGSTQGHTRFEHLGQEYAAYGFASIHLNHAGSASGYDHRFDRPADVSSVLDAIEDGTLDLPADLAGTLDIERVGHVGHSWGAYTAHAVGGATFEHGSFEDARIKGICPLSPQGWDGMGAYDEQHEITLPSEDNSWMAVRIPAYTIIGERELDGKASQNGYMGDNWRLFPFARYPEEGDKLVSVLPGMNHGDIGNSGPDQVKAFIAENTRRFLEVYVAGRAADPCTIGLLSAPPDLAVTRKNPATSGLAACAQTGSATATR